VVGAGDVGALHGSRIRVADTGLLLGMDKPRHVDQVENEDYSRVPRVRLDDDRRWWPSPPASRPGYYGVLEADTTLDPPVDI